MPPTFNLHLLIGRLGKAPDLREAKKGQFVAEVALVTSRSWKGKDGPVTQDHWHRVVVWDVPRGAPLAQQVAAECRARDMLAVVGRAESRKYTDRQTGREVFVWETIALDVQPLGPDPAPSEIGAAITRFQDRLVHEAARTFGAAAASAPTSAPTSAPAPRDG